ncbi:response regulator [Candidatus Poribacteria bacterium]|nr:response regulator [Candidatus Poribacteria bacterium]
MESSILIVEDDAVQRRQMARVLKADGYGVREASTGTEAVAKLAENNIAIVLTDRKMPGMDGVSLLLHIKANFPSIPVAIITAYMEGVEEYHPDAVLGKPFRSQELIEMVRHLLRRTND